MSTPEHVILNATITDRWGNTETVYGGSMPAWAWADPTARDPWKRAHRAALLASRTADPRGWRVQFAPTQETPVTTPTRDDLVEAVKTHALAHYNDGGWDVIVECWDDQQIAEHIGRARTPAGAVRAFRDVVAVWADQQADARVCAGGSW